MDINEITVAGAGLMGSGITQICAQAGFRVTMVDTDHDHLNKGIRTIEWSVSKLVEKGRLDQSTDAVMNLIQVADNLSHTKKSDIVFEAVFENLEIKRSLFRELDRLCPQHTILATNTSALAITNIAEATQRPDKVVGTHFFSPVPLMKIVEIVKGLLTSEQTLATATQICQKLGKETIQVNQDVAGLALNRINFPSTIEAIRLVESGVISVEDVDKGMRLAFGRPMGPFETSDMTGLDVGLNAMTAVYEETKDKKFYPPRLLQRKVKVGHLGRKTGIGWYRYDKNGIKIGPAD